MYEEENYIGDIIGHNTSLEKPHPKSGTRYVLLAAETKQLWNAEGTTKVPSVVDSTADIPRSLLTNLEALDMPTNVYI